MAPDGHHHIVHGNCRTHMLYRRLSDAQQARAAGYFHVNHRDAVELGDLNDLGQFLDVGLSIVELGAADGDRTTAKNPGMEVRTC